MDATYISLGPILRIVGFSTLSDYNTCQLSHFILVIFGDHFFLKKNQQFITQDAMVDHGNHTIGIT